MVWTVIVGAALLAAEPPGPAQPAPAEISKAATAADPAALAEYAARREKTPEKADAHYQLGLWCERKGLKAEAMLHFAAALQFDPNREAYWKRLGFKKYQGRWMTDEQVAAQKREAEAQRKADREWEPRLRKWKAWLAIKGKRAEAEAALVGVADPRAVPSVWKVFATGGVPDQERAILLLGQIPGTTSSRSLALLAVFGKGEGVRRDAIETLRRRDPLGYADVWIGLLREPLKYEVRQVAGPGSPGLVFVEGERYSEKRVYAPPSLLETEALAVGGALLSPALPPVGPDKSGPPPPGYTFVSFDGRLPLYMRTAEYQSIANDPIAMSFAPLHIKLPQAGTGAGSAAPQRSQVPGARTPVQAFSLYRFQEQVQAQWIAEWAFSEAQKMAAGAQMRLEDDVARIEANNAAIREMNGRALLALEKTIDRPPGNERKPEKSLDRALGGERKAWVAWWGTQRRGYEPKPDSEPREKPTFTVGVTLPYMPATGPLRLTPTDINEKAFCVITNIFKNIEGKTHGVLLSASCFGARTLVLTPDGPRPIEALRAGDLVLTGDGPHQAGRPGTILSVDQSEASRTLRLVLGGEAIITTEGHPLWRPGEGWTRAGDFRPGDEVLTLGGAARVEAVETGTAGMVWNLILADGSTYFVGSLGLLSHDLSPIAEVGEGSSPADR